MERASVVKLLNLFLSKHCSFLASFPLCSMFSLSENCGPDLCAGVKWHCSFSLYRLQGGNSLFASVCSSGTALLLKKADEIEHIIYEQQ